jgi:anti-sigma factor RsiW
MLSSNARIGVAAFLEQCAQQRARSSSLREQQDDPTQLNRMLQAEAAGRELMAALVRPDPYPDMSVCAILRRLIGYIQTVIAVSTPDEQVEPLLTVRVHHVRVDADAARLLCEAALVLLLAALDDSALNIDVRLDSEGTSARLSVESDRPCITADLPTFQAIRDSIAIGGGAWEAASAPHGSSWLVHVRMPLLPTQKRRKEEARCGR